MNGVTLSLGRSTTDARTIPHFSVYLSFTKRQHDAAVLQCQLCASTEPKKMFSFGRQKQADIALETAEPEADHDSDTCGLVSFAGSTTLKVDATDPRWAGRVMPELLGAAQMCDLALLVRLLDRPGVDVDERDAATQGSSVGPRHRMAKAPLSARPTPPVSTGRLRPALAFLQRLADVSGRIGRRRPAARRLCIWRRRRATPRSSLCCSPDAPTSTGAAMRGGRRCTRRRRARPCRAPTPWRCCCCTGQTRPRARESGPRRCTWPPSTADWAPPRRAKQLPAASQSSNSSK